MAVTYEKKGPRKGQAGGERVALSNGSGCDIAADQCQSAYKYQYIQSH